jgi:hypothetical protein
MPRLAEARRLKILLLPSVKIRFVGISGAKFAARFAA